MGNIAKASLEELRTMKEEGQISPPRPDAVPVELPADFWDNAEVKFPVSKQPVNLRIDADILEHFKKGGRGYQTRIHSVLRSYVDAKTAARTRDMTIANMISALARIDEVTERAAANTKEVHLRPNGPQGCPIPEIAIRGAAALAALHNWEILQHDGRGLPQAFRELEPAGSVPGTVYGCTALMVCAGGSGKEDLNLVQRAMLAAATAHGGQVRKSGEVPYIAHPLAVAMHLALAGYGRDCTAAALVHDVIANTEWDERKLAAELGDASERCLPLVRFATELSKDVSLHDRKVTETKLAEAPRVGLALVIADKSHNLRHTRPEQTWFVEALIEAIQGESGEPFDSYVDIVEAARSSD